MQIPRIYHPEELIINTQVRLSEFATRHVKQVLRLKTSAPIILFDGVGHEYPAVITAMDRRQVFATPSAVHKTQRESPLQLHLGQGISRGERMDWVIQKSVELGVQKITPLLTSRCQVKLSPERWQKRMQHWQGVVVSACEQCGRNTLLQLATPVTLADWLQAQAAQSDCYVLQPAGEKRLRDLQLQAQSATLLIGPEGGLTEQEVSLSQAFKFQTLSMGPRILRTETAAIAGISALQSLFGDA